MTVAEPHQKRNQLAGAAFNFSRNILDGEDSWSVRGAIIRPFELYNIENGPDGGGYSTDDSPMMFRAAYFIPSVSLNKVETEAADPKDEVDNLIYRMGVGGRWGGVTHSMISEIELRGFATYATDTSHDASIVAGEFDLEPRIAGQGADAKWALGFQSSLDGHTPPTDDPTDTSNFLYHLRTYLHGEFGDVRDTGGNPDLTEGDFFRLGPVARLEMYPCSLARMLGKNPQGIKLHAAYSYLPTLGGNDSDNNILFSTGLDWSIMETAAGDPIVALKLLYEKGGTELAKDEVETLTLGLGITY